MIIEKLNPQKDNIVEVDRIINSYQGKEKGPLIFVLGSIHGNEPAGTLALEELFLMLEKESEKKSDFSFRGKLTKI